MFGKLGFEWKPLDGGRRGSTTELRRHGDPQTVGLIHGDSPEVENTRYFKAVEERPAAHSESQPRSSRSPTVVNAMRRDV